MKTTAIAFTLAALTLTTACGKKKDGDATASGKPAEGAKAAAAAPAAKLEYKKIGATGLEVEAPAAPEPSPQAAPQARPSSVRPRGTYSQPTCPA